MIFSAIVAIGSVIALVWTAVIEHVEDRDLAVEQERRRITRWLRKQSEASIVASRCPNNSEIGRLQEYYASKVLAESADEIDAKYHLPKL